MTATIVYTALCATTSVLCQFCVTAIVSKYASLIKLPFSMCFYSILITLLKVAMLRSVVAWPWLRPQTKISFKLIVEACRLS